MNSTPTKPAAGRRLRDGWHAYLKNYLIAVALGLLSGATVSTLDREMLDNRTQEKPAALGNAVRYLP